MKAFSFRAVHLQNLWRGWNPHPRQMTHLAWSFPYHCINMITARPCEQTHQRRTASTYSIRETFYVHLRIAIWDRSQKTAHWVSSRVLDTLGLTLGTGDMQEIGPIKSGLPKDCRNGWLFGSKNKLTNTLWKSKQPETAFYSWIHSLMCQKVISKQ